MVPDFPQWKTNFRLYVAEICVPWAQISVKLRSGSCIDTYLFCQILEITLAVCSSNFHPRSQIGIRIIANSAESENLILHLWMEALKRPIFKRKQGSANLILSLSYFS
jgi:hypothetical protein